MNNKTETVDNATSVTVTAIRLIIIAVAYFITGRLGLEFAIIGSNITLIWLPTGIAVAALFRWGWRYWWAVWLGGMAVNLAIGSSPLIAFGISVGNTLAPLLTVVLLRRWQFNSAILNWHDVPVFTTSGAIGMMLSASGGVAVLVVGGLLPLPDAGWAWLAWWLGDAVGVIVGGMALVTFNRDELIQILNSNLRKEVLISSFIVAIIGFAWVIIPAYPIGHIFLLPMVVLVLVWIALRLGAWFAAIAALTLSACAAWALATGRGPFLDPNIHLAIAKLWAYMTTLSLASMLVSAIAAEREQIEKALSESESRWKFAIEGSGDGVWDWNIQNGEAQFSRRWKEMLGYTEEDILPNYQEWANRIHPDDQAYVAKTIQAYLDGNSVCYIIEHRLKCKDGRYKWILARGMVVSRNGDGNPLRMIGTHSDISQRKATEAELRIAAAIFESHEGMFVTDANEIILNVNQAFTRMTGYSANEAIGQTPRFISSGRHDKAFYAVLWQNIHDTGGWQGEIWNRRKNGEIYPEWLTITAVKGNNDKVTHYVATLTDITDRKMTEETINQLAFYDSLTQLPNRRLLNERLKHAIDVGHRTGKQLAVLMLDLDKFKPVNDNFGHTAGDELLQQVAQRVTSRLRKVDMVARLGGDEFVILLEDIGQYETIARIAEAIIYDLSQPFIIAQNHSASIGASIGIAIYPQHGDSAELLMDNAVTALYHAKFQGRSCFAYFSEELTQKARERLALEVRLRRAIEQKELRVYFQPQIDIISGRLVGAEALVRWYDPVYGCVMPGDFIALAEETGLIVALGEFVLRETCRLGQKWLNAGFPPITLAVNVSPYQFRRCDINALVTQILAETGFPASSLELEITESGLMDNQKQAMGILDQLHDQGVRLAIDDFGTGYSSLSYLKFFPLDVLKIDKSFIDDIPFLPSDMAIAATIIAMAHHLGFKVLAEGVETQEQLAFLLEKGCDSYQGYFCSKPVSAIDFEKLLSGGVKRL